MGDATHNQQKIILRVGRQPNSELVTSVSFPPLPSARQPLQPLANAVPIHLRWIQKNQTLTPSNITALSGVRDSPIVMGAEIQNLLIGDTS
jgi:hypothetical protein